MKQKMKFDFFMYCITLFGHMDILKDKNACILPCFPQRALPSAVNQNNTDTSEYLHIL